MDRSSTKFNSLITLKREKIILESFPNEFLLELLEFLHVAKLFHAFHNLDIHFNALLFHSISSLSCQLSLRLKISIRICRSILSFMNCQTNHLTSSSG